MDLRTLRERAGYSQARLAAISKVRAATISDIECGKITDPHYSTVRKLATALDLPTPEVAAAIAAHAPEAA